MKIISTIFELRAHPRDLTRHRVLVPTMGALHAGHVSLVRLAREKAGPVGEVLVSIFVNPLQFEPGSDFSRYPRPETADEKVCQKEGVDLVFRPLPNEMYVE
ncbi:MAG TPA: pantoate--beta-alanine ligase, partial [Chthoniobacterales bacterium]